MGGRYLLSVSAAVRRAAGISAGDEVGVEVVLDTEPRAVVVPEDFAAALAADPEAGAAFAKLAYSHQSQHVLAIEDAKTPQTRARRIEKAVEMLRPGGR